LARRFTEGRNLEIERYSSEGRTEGYPELAEYIVRRNPDVILVVSLRPVQTFKTITNTIPIVGVTSDPVVAGLASSLARPGGNVTGVTDPGYDILFPRSLLCSDLVWNRRVN
jgi:putative tryptophan/tyrosine transport system substrate-binding protein